MLVKIPLTRRSWSFSFGEELLSSHQSSQMAERIIPSLDGSLLMASKGGIKKLPVSAQTLVDRSPFQGDDGTVFLGSKVSTWD
jgi:hypothetical protein